MIHVGGTKTVNAVRDIPLTEVTEGLLNSIEPDSEGYYFRQYGTASWWTHEIRKYVSSEHTLKDLRNTFIARASDAGIIMSATQVWAGHADIRTTGNIYNNAQRQAALRSEHARLNHFYNDYFADLFQPVEKVDTHFDTHDGE